MGGILDYNFVKMCLIKKSADNCSRISSRSLIIKSKLNDEIVEIRPGLGKLYYWKNLFNDFKTISFSEKFKIENTQEMEDYLISEVVFENVKGERKSNKLNLSQVRMRIKIFRNLVEEISLIKASENESENNLWNQSWYQTESSFNLVEKYRNMLNMLVIGDAEGFCSSISRDVIVQRIGKMDEFPWYDAASMKSVFQTTSWRSIKIKKIEQIKENEIFAWFETVVAEKSSGLYDQHDNIHLAQFNHEMKMVSLHRLADLIISEPLIQPESTPRRIDTKTLPGAFLFMPHATEKDLFRYYTYVNQYKSN